MSKNNLSKLHAQQSCGYSSWRWWTYCACSSKENGWASGHSKSKQCMRWCLTWMLRGITCTRNAFMCTCSRCISFMKPIHRCPDTSTRDNCTLCNVLRNYPGWRWHGSACASVFHVKDASCEVFFKPEVRSGTKKSARCWNIKYAQSVLGRAVCNNNIIMLFSHAILGCDPTSRVFSMGKGLPLKHIVPTSTS